MFEHVCTLCSSSVISLKDGMAHVCIAASVGTMKMNVSEVVAQIDQ